MKKTLAALLVVASASTAMAQSATQPPYTPQVGPRVGDYEATLSGSGTSTNDFDNNTFGATGTIAYFFTDAIEVGLEQSIGFTVGDDDLVEDAWNGRSLVFVDYNFNLGRFRPYVGAAVGGIYGKNVDDDGLYGLRGGLKYYVSEATFLQLGASYTPTFEDAFDEAVLNYTLGVGFNF
ncbi:MAG: outer membrane beta-barrel protein [Rhodospirillales bacterium]|nr:outer membrane beta-barrel protein [Rhodospirillales bacterium]